VFFNNLNPTQTLIEKLLLEVTSDALGIRVECLLPQNANFSLAAKIALIHFETPEIAKMLQNVHKGSCIGKYPLRKAFTVDFPC
jgi:hypothetical protein